MYFQTKDKSECCACTACVSACPKSCISMVLDEEGFAYPSIDENICINCHLCEKVCPVEHPDYSNNKKPKTYAAFLKDENERQKSSSGGAFYAIAKYVLDNKGVVIGATMDDNLQVRHITVDSEEELHRLRGSKYVQSELKEIFAQIKEILQQNRWCYFVGTGCQVAGLKAYIRKDYPTLITSDLVCHGVPCQKLFDKHIEYLEDKYRDKVVGYQFRDNESWGGCEIVDFANRKQVINPSYELSPYLYSFMYAMTYRDSCYDCKFACIPRQGDITLADFWGVDKFFPNINTNHGVSLILVNNENGIRMWDKIKNQYEYYLSTVEDGAKYNGNLIHCSQKPEIRENIYQTINIVGYKKVAETLFKSPHIWRIKLFQVLQKNACLRIILILYRKLRK